MADPAPPSDPATEPPPGIDGADLCLACLHPVRPEASLCQHCGAPQDFIAATLPFLSVLAEGFVYHRAIQTPRSWLTLVGVWLLFGELWIGGGLIFWIAWSTISTAPTLTWIDSGIPALVHAVLGVSGIALARLPLLDGFMAANR